MKCRLCRRIGVQLVGLLAIGILAANLIGVFITLQGTPPAIHVASRARVLERLASAVRIAEVAPQDSVDEVLNAMSLSSERFWFADAPVVSGPMGETEQTLARNLRSRIGPGREHEVRIRFTEGDERARAGESGAFSPGFLVSVQLDAGRWLNAERSGLEPRKWWLQLPFSITASIVPVVLIGLYFSRRIVLPVRRLAAAAERIGRGEAVPPVPLEGPEELRETTAAFNAMQARILRFVQDRMHLLAAVSHDLRTPITALKLRSEMVPDPALRDALRRTLDEMGEMVEATLSFAREEAGEEPTRVLDLVALADAVADDQQTLGHAVTLLPGPARLPYRCRPASLRRALGNLVDNAVRYAGGARIGVAVEGTAIVISVDDDGPGVPEAMRKALFEPFMRLESSRSGETGGVGLGLAIVRSCVRAHGGEATLQNRPGGGLRAELRLPR